MFWRCVGFWGKSRGFSGNEVLDLVRCVSFRAQLVCVVVGVGVGFWGVIAASPLNASHTSQACMLAEVQGMGGI